MKHLINFPILLQVCASLPQFYSQSATVAGDLTSQPQYSLDLDSNRPRHFLLPFEDHETAERASEIAIQRKGFLYGPSLLGDTSYFPTGVLGDALVQRHVDQWLRDADQQTRTVETEIFSARKALGVLGFHDPDEKSANSSEIMQLHKIEDYRLLYDGQWKKSNPSGIALGMLSNSTQDLMFSMERLSVNPYAVKRLHPTGDILPFEVNSSIVKRLSGHDLGELHHAGHLFYADHSYQANYPTASGKFFAACSAYFFIHPDSGDFLPLAIKAHTEADLVYTPLDTEEDWLLAKTMFNMNDLFHGQMFHLANSHAVCEIIHQAALRTLSRRHPVLGLLDHLMHSAYAIRPVGEKFLFNDGGYFDQSFAITNEGVRQFATSFYPYAAGRFEAGYFLTDLVSRGLINCTYGPDLKNFPFHEDAGKIHSSQREFVTSYISAYYTTEGQLERDDEIQSWVLEAVSDASVIDFPHPPVFRKETLIDILTQVAFLVGVSHHVLNSGEPIATSGVLPFHPSALYAPPPREKGVKELMPFLTPPEQAVQHVALLARFNRPNFEDTNETLVYMFDSSSSLLDKCRPQVRQAALVFHHQMQNLSNEMRHREFDSAGLSQGMPFVWRGLDPARIPRFLSV